MKWSRFYGVSSFCHQRTAHIMKSVPGQRGLSHRALLTFFLDIHHHVQHARRQGRACEPLRRSSNVIVTWRGRELYFICFRDKAGLSKNDMMGIHWNTIMVY